MPVETRRKNMRTKIRRGLAAVAAFLVGTGLLAAAERRPITETDILKFQWVADPQISPDGKEVAYVLVTVDRKSTRLNSSHSQISYAVFCLKKKKKTEANSVAVQRTEEE